MDNEEKIALLTEAAELAMLPLLRTVEGSGYSWRLIHSEAEIAIQALRRALMAVTFDDIKDDLEELERNKPC